MRGLVSEVQHVGAALLLRSVFFGLAAVVVASVLVASFAFVNSANHNPIIVAGGLFAIVIAGAVFVAVFGYLAELFGQRARDVNAQTIFEALVRDEPTAPFSLYLRPFNSTDDISEIAQQVVPSIGRIGFLPGERIELEAQLERGTRGFAPLVCLGRPLGHIGAGRIQSSDSAWKSSIARLMDTAEVIILLPSMRPGTLHEIETILSSALVQKTLFLDAPRSDIVRRYQDAEDWPEVKQVFERYGYALPAQTKRGQIFFYGDQNEPILIERLDMDDEDNIGRFGRRVAKWIRVDGRRREKAA